MFSAAAYAAQLRALMPKGLAWPEGEEIGRAHV